MTSPATPAHECSGELERKTVTKTKPKAGDRVRLLKDVGFEPELGITVGSEGVIVAPYTFQDETPDGHGFKALFEGYEYPFGVYVHEIEVIEEDEESID